LGSAVCSGYLVRDDSTAQGLRTSGNQRPV
jgi:hypothetical protein